MADLIQDLLEPGLYPEETKGVDLVQTHISLVFITDEYVYKIKKPVDFGFLDFTDLEKREYYCQSAFIEGYLPRCASDPIRGETSSPRREEWGHRRICR